MLSKYQFLAEFLAQSNQDMIRMTFAEVEDKIQGKLPPAALEHRAWWANSETNSHARYGWMSAGYETSSVDMVGRELVFVRAVQDERPHMERMLLAEMRAPAPQARRRGQSELEAILQAAGGVDNLERIVGAIQQYIDGDLLETELGRILRKLWPRR